MQEIVDQGVYDDHLGPDVEPMRALVAIGHQNRRQRHRQHFVGNAKDMTHRPYQRFLARQKIASSSGVELLLDPADQVAFGDISNKEVKAKCRLIKPAIAKWVGWNGTCFEVTWL
jgi:hypothetical protein